MTQPKVPEEWRELLERLAREYSRWDLSLEVDTAVDGAAERMLSASGFESDERARVEEYERSDIVLTSHGSRGELTHASAAQVTMRTRSDASNAVSSHAANGATLSLRFRMRGNENEAH